MDRSAESSASTMAGETDLLLPPNPEAPPKDRLYMVYIILYMLGVGCLLPWNFFSNAKQYFMYKLRDEHNSSFGHDFDHYFDPQNLTHLQVMFESYLSIAAMVPNIIFMFLNTVLVKSVALRWRMLLATVLMVMMFVVTISLVKVNTDGWQRAFFGVSLGTIVVMNGGSAFLQGGVFGLSSMFPPKYTQAVMGGMGLGGTVAAAVNIVAVSLTNNPIDMGFWYFSIALAFLTVALAGYTTLSCTRFGRYYTQRHENARRQRASVNERAKSGPLPGPSTAEVHVEAPHSDLVSTFFKMWKFSTSVFLIFFVTLSCYPAVNSAILSTASNKAWKETYFMPVSCFLFFNFFDLCGRTTAGWVQWPSSESPNKMLIIAVCRVAFIPLFLLCNIQPRNIPVLFYSDAIPMVLMVFFGFTNGYFGTLAMVYGPRRVQAADLELAGSLMSFFLSAGLGAGSLFSFGLIKVL